LKFNDAPKAQREGSRTCNVWSAAVKISALKERQKNGLAASSTRKIPSLNSRGFTFWLLSLRREAARSQDFARIVNTFAREIPLIS
jgi:hypothetical protein